MNTSQKVYYLTRFCSKQKLRRFLDMDIRTLDKYLLNNQWTNLQARAIDSWYSQVKSYEEKFKDRIQKIELYKEEYLTENGLDRFRVIVGCSVYYKSE